MSGSSDNVGEPMAEVRGEAGTVGEVDNRWQFCRDVRV